MLTWPPVPTATITRFGTVSPARKFKVELSGVARPAGNTVRKPGVLGFVAVTFKTTAETPLAGTPPRPVTWRLSVWPGLSLARGAPLPVLVSSTRDGIRGLKRPSGPGDASGVE